MKLNANIYEADHTGTTEQELVRKVYGTEAEIVAALTELQTGFAEGEERVHITKQGKAILATVSDSDFYHIAFIG